MGDPVRRETATTTVAADAIEIKRKEFLELRREDARLDPLQKDVSRRVIDNARMQVRPEAGSLMNFLMREGLGEATNVLVIDESLCVGCDNCEKACAETHGGVSRLDREAGATYANVHIPTACRHCEQPHCMKDCPPNAIRRSESGEVYINDSCIGCGNCQANCPYGVIRMVYDAPKKRPAVVAVLGGSGPGEQPATSRARGEGERQESGEVRASASTAARACAHARPAPRSASGRSSSSISSRSRSGDPPPLLFAERATCGGRSACWWSRACSTRRRATVQPPNGGWQGYVLGSIGALLICGSRFLGVRKRPIDRRWAACRAGLRRMSISARRC